MSANVCAARLVALRAVMDAKNISAIIIPTADYHSSEYVAPCFRLREYFCGFTGSAGTLVVLKEEAALFTDGRYFIQAGMELSGTGVDLMRMGEAGVLSLEEYLFDRLPEGSVLAFDARCITKKEGDALKNALEEKNISFLTSEDPAGDTWKERPDLPLHPVYLLDEEKYAGEKASSKLSRLRAKMKKKNVSWYVSGKLDEIMWLFNIRGNDVECNPVALSYLLVSDQEARLYIQEKEVGEDVREHAKREGFSIHPYEDFFADAQNLADPLGKNQKGKVWYDPESTSYAVFLAVQKSLMQALDPCHALGQLCRKALLSQHILESPSPLDAMKAIRNETEIRNFKSVYLEDSALLTKFIYRIKKRVQAGEALTEGDAAACIDGMRAGVSDFVELSFTTISAYGPNAAMMHYEPDAAGGAALMPKGMLLVDSGGHYLRGTTDVTRTFALGEVTDDMKRDYTRTAISFLAMMDTVFLKGCCGMALDIMAREPMWKNGMDYKCGTGHGIGYLLNVHEGPQTLRYRFRSDADAAPFESGMIISDEPGVYKEGKYGIRIETILLCREWGTTPDGDFLCFEPITFVPLDKDLLDLQILTEQAKESLNRYHKETYEKLLPFMDEEEAKWLTEQCAPVV